MTKARYVPSSNPPGDPPASLGFFEGCQHTVAEVSRGVARCRERVARCRDSRERVAEVSQGVARCRPFIPSGSAFDHCDPITDTLYPITVSDHCVHALTTVSDHCIGSQFAQPLITQPFIATAVHSITASVHRHCIRLMRSDH